METKIRRDREPRGTPALSDWVRRAEKERGTDGFQQRNKNGRWDLTISSEAGEKNPSWACVAAAARRRGRTRGPGSISKGGRRGQTVRFRDRGGGRAGVDFFPTECGVGQRLRQKKTIGEEEGSERNRTIRHTDSPIRSRKSLVQVFPISSLKEFEFKIQF